LSSRLVIMLIIGVRSAAEVNAPSAPDGRPPTSPLTTSTACAGTGRTDEAILDVVLATAARCFFSTVLDATGTLADAGFAERLGGDLRAALTVGRPLAPT
jgi:hypothetical protein